MTANLKLAALTLMSLLCGDFTMHAQISERGIPLTLQNDKINWNIPQLTMDAFDVDEFLQEDEEVNALKNQPYRFGKNFYIGRNIKNSGSWHKLPDGGRVWLLKLKSPGAFSLNLTFDLFDLPEGGRLFIYSPDYTHILGAYTHKNNSPEMGFGTYPVPGDELIIEYYEPQYAMGQTQLQIEAVTHAYRDLDVVARGIGDSGACNNNVICPEGDDWRDEIDAVAMIVVNGNGICTGALINNTANDGHPYFLTANHCLGGNVSNWVYRFNWQSTTCAGNNVGDFQTVGGSQLLASGAAADYALIRINNGDPVPEDYNPFYAGWDASGANPTSQVGVHHPRGDLKKISFDTDPAGTATYGSATCWRVFDWEDGTTEPGSSGSPLFDQNKRVIGQLYGGQATCSNNVNDYYGKFDVTYPNICQWIAPGCNTLVIDGYSPNAIASDNDVQLVNVLEPNGIVCDNSVVPSITVRNAGSNALTSFTITYNLNGGANQNQNWSGNLASGATTVVSLPALTPGNGTYTFNVSLNNPNGVSDDNPANNNGSSNFTLVTDGININFTLLTDNYPGETTWDIRDEANNILYSDGPYGAAQSTFNYNFCLPAGCYDLNVYDSFGDGMQYQGIVGNYTLTLDDGTVLAQMVDGGDFGSQATHEFCLTATVIPGCTDIGACNFNPSAGSDDGSCEYLTCSGCTDSAACNYDPSATIDNGGCDYETCSGCTDPLAENYDAGAAIDDGSCTYSDCTPVTLSVTTDCWGEEVSWVLTDEASNAIASSPAGAYGNQQTYQWSGCLTAGCYTFTISDEYGDGMFGSQYGNCEVDGDYFLTDGEGNVLFQMGEPDYGFSIDEDFCIDVEGAVCIGDLNNDGTVDASDILLLLAAYGCSQDCNADIDGDGLVNTADFLIILSVFGTFCD